MSPTKSLRARLTEQLKVSGGGVFGAAVAVPLVISNWVPPSVAIAWGIVYLLQSLFFLTAISMPTPVVDSRLWAVTTAVLFALINGSVLLWGDSHPGSVWIAGMVSFGYIAFEAATLPYLKVKQWYLGIAIVSVSMTLLVAVETHVIVGLAIAPVMLSITMTAGRAKELQDDLDDRLVETEMMLFADPLTGLINRRGLEAAFVQLQNTEATVATFDADRFKLINDTQGHVVGDQALRLIAERLKANLAPTWTIARYGGDEFVAITPGRADVHDAATASFEMPLADRPGEVLFTMSAGLATGIVSDAGDRLLSESGHALRHAKREGIRTVRSEGDLQARFNRSMSITAAANAADRIVPVTQVIVDEHGVAGCELLARWRTDDGTLLAPGQFMDMLIENGLLGRLDSIMLEHAVKLAAHLKSIGADVFVSVNIAASRLLDQGLIGTVGGLLEIHGVAPGQLMIEITESERLGSDRRWESAVHGLRDLGIKLAIDDFGAGYSSVARLRKLPITHLKLDRSLVTSANGPLGEIVGGVVRFCQETNIGVVAEGIETVEDQRSMRDLNVDFLQGYLFGRPIRIADFLRDLDERTEHRSTVESKPRSAPTSLRG